MLILAFDTSSPAVTVAVVEGPTSVLAERSEVAANRHGELLAPMIRDALAETGAASRDLTAIAAGLGPGPFTGLRVGIVTARAMSDSLRIPAYGESSLDVISADLQPADWDYAVLSDARRKQVYWSAYAHDGTSITPPDIGAPEAVANALPAAVTHLAGAGAVMYRDAFPGRTVLAEPRYPRAATLGALVCQRVMHGDASDALVPLYLRRPDAQVPGKPKAVTPA